LRDELLSLRDRLGGLRHRRVDLRFHRRLRASHHVGGRRWGRRRGTARAEPGNGHQSDQDGGASQRPMLSSNPLGGH